MQISSQQVSGTTTKGVFRFNDEKNGVEVLFEKKPDERIISVLKVNGFRWSRYQKLWYARQTEKAIVIAQKVAAQAVA